MIGDRVSGGGAGETRSDAGAQPGESCWTLRVLLLGPALMQLVVAYVLAQDLRGGGNAPAVLMPLILLALGGAGGIVAGVFGRYRKMLHLGILCALLGLALPVAINAAATPVDQSTSVIPGLGDFGAEGLGTLMLSRILVELPFWGLAVIAMFGYLRSGRAENGMAAPPKSSGPPHR